MKHEVQISRDIKNSPYNCKVFIPEIECKNRYNVIELPEVQNELRALYGRKFVVTVHTQGMKSYLMYNIEREG